MAACEALRVQYLEQLASRLRKTSKSALHIGTQEFVDCCDTILPFFDHLGPVFHVARGEFQQKLESLKQEVQNKPLLTDIVDADRRANRATVKNSCTRNLHRLATAILFVKLLFERLIGAAVASTDPIDAAVTQNDPAAADITLRDAASAAYEVSLAPFHTTVVRSVVRAGMLTLPSKEHFIASIGESPESAAVRAREVISACQAVHTEVTKLLDGIEMPASNVWFWPRS